MSKPDLLITGASGFLGYNLCRELSDDFIITGTYATQKPTAQISDICLMDLSDSYESITDCIPVKKFKAIIHTAAIADAGRCEKEQHLAKEINTDGALKITKLAQKLDIPLIFISTDLVYSKGIGPFREDQASPGMVYSRSKFEAERNILNLHQGSSVLRCALIYGPDDGQRISFVRKMDRNIKNKKALTLFTDQYRSPLWAPDIAEAVKTIIADNVHGEIFNLGGPDRLTRYAFGQIAARIFNWNPKLVKPVKIADLPLAFRSTDSSLNSKKAGDILNWRNTSVTAGLTKLKASWN